MTEASKSMQPVEGPLDPTVRPLSREGGGLAVATLSQILRAAKPVTDIAGVYFLVRGKWPAAKVVYVGQSLNVYARVAQHSATKSFDSWAFVRCTPDELDLVESTYIHWLKPEDQGRLTGRSAAECAAPMRSQDVHHLVCQLPRRKHK